MESFLPFFLLLFAGVVFSALSQKLHLPWVAALIAAGVFMGPEGFAVVENNEVLSFIGEVGLIFLMFMAGLEVKFSGLKQVGLRALVLASLHAGASFAAGYFIGVWLGESALVCLLLGIVFTSTSVAVVVPAMESSNLLHTSIGKTIMAATVIADIGALILLSVVLQQVHPTATLPLPFFYALLVGALIALRFLLPRVEHFLAKFHKKRDQFQQELRAVLTVMVGTVIVLELLGLHPIIAGFYAGLVLSDAVRSKVLLGKLRALSYGFFIPTFFIIVGLEMNISVFQNGGEALRLLGLLAVAAVVVKLVSGWLGARLGGFGNRESLLAGAATIPQLSTTLAVVFAATAVGLFNEALTSSLVALGIVTTIIGPLFIRLFSRKL